MPKRKNNTNATGGFRSCSCAVNTYPITGTRHIQSLWAGAGSISRVHCTCSDSGESRSFISKDVNSTGKIHAKWRSYQCEATYLTYTHELALALDAWKSASPSFARDVQSVMPIGIPQAYCVSMAGVCSLTSTGGGDSVDADDDGAIGRVDRTADRNHFRFLMEDMRPAFPVQVCNLNLKQTLCTLDWLARFHAFFWKPKSCDDGDDGDHGDSNHSDRTKKERGDDTSDDEDGVNGNTRDRKAVTERKDAKERKQMSRELAHRLSIFRSQTWKKASYWDVNARQKELRSMTDGWEQGLYSNIFTYTDYAPSSSSRATSHQPTFYSNSYTHGHTCQTNIKSGTADASERKRRVLKEERRTPPGGTQRTMEMKQGAWDNLALRLQRAATAIDECMSVHDKDGDDDSSNGDCRRYGTIIHGDPKAANIFFSSHKPSPCPSASTLFPALFANNAGVHKNSNGKSNNNSNNNNSDTVNDRSNDTGAANVAFCDFQWTGQGLGAIDLVYMFLTSIELKSTVISSSKQLPSSSSVAVSQEMKLLQYYHQRLCHYLRQNKSISSSPSICTSSTSSSTSLPPRGSTISTGPHTSAHTRCNDTTDTDYPFDLFLRHYQLVFVDYVRFLVGWGLWGNDSDWYLMNAHFILTQWEDKSTKAGGKVQNGSEYKRRIKQWLK